MLRRAILTLALLVGAAGCSDESDPSASDPTDDTSEDASEDTAEDRADPQDQQIADDAILTLDDLPSGWEQQPSSTEEDEEQEEELDRAFADCLDIDPAELDDDGAKADSSFVDAEDAEISSEVAFRSSVEDLQEDLDRIREPAAADCYVEVIGELFASEVRESGEDVEIGEITFNPLSFDDLGDDSTAFRLSVPLSQDGFEVDLFVDFVLVARGRAGITMSFTSYFSPFDEAQALELTEIVVDRVPSTP